MVIVLVEVVMAYTWLDTGVVAMWLESEQSIIVTVKVYSSDVYPLVPSNITVYIPTSTEFVL